MDQVDDNDRYYYIAADYVYEAEKPAKGDFVGDGLNTPESVVRMGNIVEKQHYAGYYLDNKGNKCNKTQGAKKIDAFGSPVSPEMLIDQFFKAYPHFYPVLYVI